MLHLCVTTGNFVVVSVNLPWCLRCEFCRGVFAVNFAVMPSLQICRGVYVVNFAVMPSLWNLLWRLRCEFCCGVFVTNFDVVYSLWSLPKCPCCEFCRGVVVVNFAVMPCYESAVVVSFWSLSRCLHCECCRGVYVANFTVVPSLRILPWRLRCGLCCGAFIVNLRCGSSTVNFAVVSPLWILSWCDMVIKLWIICPSGLWGLDWMCVGSRDYHTCLHLTSTLWLWWFSHSLFLSVVESLASCVVARNCATTSLSLVSLCGLGHRFKPILFWQNTLVMH